MQNGIKKKRPWSFKLIYFKCGYTQTDCEHFETTQMKICWGIFDFMLFLWLFVSFPVFFSENEQWYQKAFFEYVKKKNYWPTVRVAIRLIVKLTDCAIVC